MRQPKIRSSFCYRLNNAVQHEYKPYKVILSCGLEISLFSKLEHFESIAQMKMPILLFYGGNYVEKYTENTHTHSSLE